MASAPNKPALRTHNVCFLQQNSFCCGRGGAPGVTLGAQIEVRWLVCSADIHDLAEPDAPVKFYFQLCACVLCSPAPWVSTSCRYLWWQFTNPTDPCACCAPWAPSPPRRMDTGQDTLAKRLNPEPDRTRLRSVLTLRSRQRQSTNDQPPKVLRSGRGGFGH